MKQFTAVAVAVLLLVVTGVVHGLMLDRWGPPERLINAAARLEQIPASMGDWSSQDLEITDRVQTIAGAQGMLSRLYTHRPTGSSINVLIVCGRPGPVAEHPPTVCFTSAGFRLAEKERKHVVRSRDNVELGEFWLGDFSKSTDLVPENMRTFWGWSSDGRWEAADNPRLKYAPSPVLYKLYVTRPLVRTGDEVDDNDLAIQFMHLFLPELQRALFDDGQRQAPATSHPTEGPTQE
jgi:hypothetical protein